MNKIKIITKTVQMEAELNDTQTAKLIYKSLPIESALNLWGEEIYFSVPVKTELENGVEVVQEGDIGYWPTGNAFCIFFGKTPVSTDKEIKPASAVTLIGKLIGNPKELKKVKSGEKITLEKV